MRFTSVVLTQKLLDQKDQQKWLHIISGDQIILKCTRRPGTVSFIQCIPITDVVVELAQVRKDVFSMFVNMLNK